jgi:hypothetical protein
MMGHGAHRFTGGSLEVHALAVAWGALLLGCAGQAADPERDVSPAPSSETEMDLEGEGGGEGEGEGEEVSADPVGHRVDASPLCESPFQACGGTLAGSWIVEGACSEESTAGAPGLQWDRGYPNVDFTVCTDAMMTLTSRWSGNLVFENGEAIDERLRSDTLALDLTGNCLGKALSVDVHEQNLAAVCSSVGTESMACAALNGVCHCSGQRSSRPAASGGYGVNGTRVVVGSIRGQAFFDYCVEGDLLRIQDPDSGHEVLLRRAPQTPD